MKIKLNAGNYCEDVRLGHLKMGGENPDGVEITANSRYFTIDGEAVLPVMGEFHFARYPHKYWEDELLKMKACGIGIVASYIYWIFHEEEKGKWQWEGDKNLRRFAELCDKHGLYFFPRIGPYVHGECRNGGLPDWIWDMPEKRTDDPVYMSYAEKFYAQIAAQLKGLMYKDGGPVMGVQLDNEYWLGKEGEQHILTLKNTAKKVGIDVPIYTVTGWMDGSVPKDEVIPVFGGYPAATWEMEGEKVSRKVGYFFLPFRNQNFIENDLKLKQTGYAADLSRYPFALAELGAGIQVTHHCRPVVSGDDIAAILLTKLGSGASLVGYYIFHGSTHPDGKLTPMHEIYDRPWIMEYPEKSYDFEAPIREFGQISPSYHDLKVLHLFLNDFGSLLAPMVTLFPEKQPESIANTDILRFAARVSKDSGFLFFNNYQRLTRMPNFQDCTVELKLKNETLTLPQKPFCLKNGKYFIWPFNLTMGQSLLKYATAQPLCKISNDGADTYFFFAIDGIDTEYCFDSKTTGDVTVFDGKISKTKDCLIVSGIKGGADSVVSLVTPTGKKIDIVTLTEKQAKNCWKQQFLGKERVFISESNIIFEAQKLKLYSNCPKDMSFSVFPQVDRELCEKNGKIERQKDGVFSRYTLSRPAKQVDVNIKPSEESNQEVKKWSLSLPKDAFDGVDDLYLQIHYTGNHLKVLLDGKLVSDTLYNGLAWEVGLKRFLPEVLSKEITLEITPIAEGKEPYLEEPGKAQELKSAEVVDIKIIPEYSIVITETRT